MSTITLRLPEALHRLAKELAKQEGVSMNQFIATALTEKMSAIASESYLETRARRGSREMFEQVLTKVPHVEPDEHDRIDAMSRAGTEPIDPEILKQIEKDFPNDPILQEVHIARVRASAAAKAMGMTLFEYVQHRFPADTETKTE
jgi:hypothetical protein